MKIERSESTLRLPERSFKLVVVGDTGTGKTALIERLAKDVFKETHDSTIANDYFSAFYYVDKHPVQLQIWDTCGLENYRAINKLYFRGAHAILICIDLSTPLSTPSLEGWLSSIQDHSYAHILIYIIGTKKDLVQGSSNSIMHTDLKHEITGSVQLSSKTGEGIAQTLSMIFAGLMDLCSEYEGTHDHRHSRLSVDKSFGYLPKKSCAC